MDSAGPREAGRSAGVDAPKTSGAAGPAASDGAGGAGAEGGGADAGGGRVHSAGGARGAGGDAHAQPPVVDGGGPGVDHGGPPGGDGVDGIDRGGAPGDAPDAAGSARRDDPFAETHLFGTYTRLPVAFDRGEGVRLRDVEGREYLDFLAGIAVSSLGHAHPDLVAALREQVGRYLHVSNLYHVPEQAAAARRLAEASGLDRAFFCNSGAEAVEAAVKLARKRGRSLRGPACHEIVVMDQSFHGRTLGALAATGVRRYREPFAPLPRGFRFVPFDDVDTARRAVGPSTCAVLVEPVQGEAGVWPASRGYLEALREMTSAADALLILDEVQTGIGRTGRMFAFQRYGVTPDAVTLAKGLGGGVAVGALLAEETVSGHLVPGDHASTFGGNPLAATAASTVLDVIRRDELCRRAREVGRHLRDGLLELAETTGRIREVRGAGLLIGVDLDVEAGPVARACLDRGLLVNAAGPRTLRLAPPLVVTEADADEALELLGHVLAATSPEADGTG